MKRILMILLSVAMIFSLTACGGGNSSGDNGAAAPSESSQSESTQPEASDDESQTMEDGDVASVSSGELSTDEADGAAEEDSAGAMEKDSAGAMEEDSADIDGENSSGSVSDSHILIAFFSHTGENHSVGVIEKGNTHIIADMIAEETGADLFEIKTVNPYPDTYDECTNVAKQEQNENARPEIIDPPENLDEYDTVFIGYPIWWGDLPMAVYTFLENYDFSGKTVIPFCTHEGSGLSGTKSSIEGTCSGATVPDGLAIRGTVAQNEQEKAKADVLEWLDGLGL